MNAEQEKLRSEAHAVKDRALNMAFIRGLESGAVGFISGGLLSFAAIKSQYGKYMSTSARASIPIMLGIFTFSVVYEQGINDTIVNPEKWGLVPKGSTAAVPAEKHSSLPLYKRAANYMNDHPFTLIAGLGIPLASTILYQNMQLTHLSFSQKIMHSRVMAQGGVLAILLSVMGLKSFMDGHGGRFKEDDE